MNPTKQKFGDFELDVAGYELRRNGRSVKLERIPMELLLLLVDRRGQLVTRDEILEKLWGKDTFLDVDNSINTAISKIRVALKDDPENPAFIKTVPGKGYRFIAAILTSGDGTDAQVSSLDDVSGATEPVVAEKASPELESKAASKPRRLWLAPATVGLLLAAALGAWNWRDSLKRMVRPSSSPVIRSLAVLPLENLSGDPSQEYFAEGMTDALITNLAQINALRVISRTSAMRYKATKKSLPEVAQELHVDGIVEGSVVRVGDRVRITAQLIDAHSDQHLWAATYERSLRDVLALQDEVARDISGEIRVKLTAREHERLATARPIDPEAYQLYLKGRYFWNKRTGEAYQTAVEYFQQAINKDPAYALAYAGLADAYIFMGGTILPPAEAMAKARAAARKAIELDETLAEPHTTLGLIAMYDVEWAEAGRQYRLAIQLNPNYATAHHWYAEHLTPLGRFDEALSEIQRAQELDPLSLIINTDVGKTLYCSRKYDQAIGQLRKTLEMDSSFVLAKGWLARAYEQKGMYAEAITLLEQPNRPYDDRPTTLSDLGHAYAAAGRREDAHKVLAELERMSRSTYVDPYHSMFVYLGLGDKEAAFAWLQKCLALHSNILVYLKVDPDFDFLRSDPRFADLVHRVGLPP